MRHSVRHLIGELSRRHVFKVAGVYAAVAFIVFQAADLIFEALQVPEWAFSVVVVGGILGAPIALVLAWAFDLTPEGVVRTDAAPVAAGPTEGALAMAHATAAPALPGAARAESAHEASRSHAPPPVAASRNAIAVLPFANFSGDPENDYFSDGITDDVITGLCKVPGLKVISRTSVMQYRNAARNLKEIARELGVGSVVEGSVRRHGDRVRVTAQLIDAESDQHLWAEVFDRKLEDVFSIQSDVALQVAGALRAELTPHEGERLRSSPTQSVEAYDLYLRGRHLWNRRSVEDVRRSVEYFERALAEDPTFALAAAGLADAFVILGIYGAEEPARVMRHAREAADRALQRDPTLAEALTARACVRATYDWDWSAAESEFRNATRLAPQYGTAHQWFAMHCLVPLGRFDEAMEQLRLASELDPISPAVRASRGVVHYFAGRPDAAAAEYRAVLDTHPEFAIAHYFLGQALDELGRSEEAAAAIGEAARLSGRTPEIVAALGHTLARAGDQAGAEALLAELEALAGKRYVSAALPAQVLAGLGNHERALAALGRARAARAADLIWLGVRPVFAPLRAEPAFKELLESVGLPPAEG